MRGHPSKTLQQILFLYLLIPHKASPAHTQYGMVLLRQKFASACAYAPTFPAFSRPLSLLSHYMHRVATHGSRPSTTLVQFCFCSHLVLIVLYYVAASWASATRKKVMCVKKKHIPLSQIVVHFALASAAVAVGTAVQIVVLSMVNVALSWAEGCSTWMPPSANDFLY